MAVHAKTYFVEFHVRPFCRDDESVNILETDANHTIDFSIDR